MPAGDMRPAAAAAVLLVLLLAEAEEQQLGPARGLLQAPAAGGTIRLGPFRIATTRPLAAQAGGGGAPGAEPKGDGPAAPKGDAPAAPKGDAPAAPKGDAPASPAASHGAIWPKRPKRHVVLSRDGWAVHEAPPPAPKGAPEPAPAPKPKHRRR